MSDIKQPSEMSSLELIEEHHWRWQAWLKRRRDFGELGATSDSRMMDLEREGMKRGIPDEVMTNHAALVALRNLQEPIDYAAVVTKLRAASASL